MNLFFARPFANLNRNVIQKVNQRESLAFLLHPPPPFKKNNSSVLFLGGVFQRATQIVELWKQLLPPTTAAECLSLSSSVHASSCGAGDGDGCAAAA